ncbi:Proline-rich receptor-like protein kinase PERK1 [Bienertia sinuspersici]
MMLSSSGGGSQSPPSSCRGESPSPPTCSSGLGSGSSSTPDSGSSLGSGSGSSPNSGLGGSNEISTGKVVGIAVVGVVILVIFSIICVCCSRKKKKRRTNEFGEEYYVPPPLHPTLGPKAEHYQVPKPPASPAASPRPPRPPSPQTPPPPPGQFLSSGGGSGSNFGSENQLPPPSPGLSLGFSKSPFLCDELAMATNGFSVSSLLGQGGFGYVHKGVLPNGKEVAVSRVHQKPLVSLVGYCITGSHRLLVYEFVPNKTMEFLHGKGQPTMEWPTRMRIALGAVKGLAYLHEDCKFQISSSLLLYYVLW